MSWGFAIGASSVSLLMTLTESIFKLIGMGTAASKSSTTTSSLVWSTRVTFACSRLNGPEMISTMSFFCMFISTLTCSIMCSISL